MKFRKQGGNTMSLKARINSEVWVDAPEQELMKALTTEEFDLFPLKNGSSSYTKHLHKNLHSINGWVTLKEEDGGTLLGVSLEYPLGSGNDDELSDLELLGEELSRMMDNMKSCFESEKSDHSRNAFDLDCFTSEALSA
jgi:hypothetical protein